jgi:hypothetical protein
MAKEQTNNILSTFLAIFVVIYTIAIAALSVAALVKYIFY